MNNPYYINTGLGNVYKSGGSFKKYKKAVKKLYDAYLWGSPETELTKKEYKKYKKDLWEGLNQSKEVLASLNKEELKHPTNGQLVESYNNDNEIPLDYNYNVFNTARRDREQALLDAYNYNQSLLTSAQREANRVAARDDYRGLAYLLNGIALSPFVLSGAGLNLTKGLYNLLNNPLVDTALTAHGVMKAPSNVKEGIKNIKEGDFGKGMLDLGLTSLDMLGAGRLAKRIAPAAVNFFRNIPYVFKPLPEIDVLPDVFETLRKSHVSNQSVHPNIYRSIHPRQRLAGRSVFDSVHRPEVRYSLNPSNLFSSSAAYGNNKITISPRLLFKERNIIEKALPHEYEHYFQTYYSPQLSISGNNYWVFNPRHPLRDTLSLFDKELGPLGRRREWIKSPDELDAEMVQWKHDMSIPLSRKYLDFESDLQDEFINKTINEFNFDKEDVQKILLDLSRAGYFANGGSLDANPGKPPVNVDLDTKYDTKLPKEKEQAYAQWVESLPLNLRDDHDYDLRGAFLEGLKPDKYGHMSDKYKKPWHPTFSNESIYSTKDMQGGHWEGDEFIPSPWQERRQQLINSMNLMEPNTFSNGGTIHIKPENKGKFTAAAKRAGKSVQGYASQILANPDNYSSTLVKRANFAHVFGGRNYGNGGYIRNGVYEISEDEYNRLIDLGYDIEIL